jgi:hypothetical protein
MQQPRDKGNTVLIVEHKPDMIANADHVARHPGKHRDPALGNIQRNILEIVLPPRG